MLIASVLCAGGVSFPLLSSEATQHAPGGIAAGTAEEGAEEGTEEATEGAASELALFVAPEHAVVTADETEIRFSVLVRNSGDSTAPEGSVELTLGERITGESASQPASAEPADSAVEGAAQQSETPRTVIATVSLDGVAAGKEQSATVAVPLADLPQLTPAAHGVYPVHASYVASDAPAADPVTAVSPLVWGGPGAAEASVNLTTIVPLTLPASVQSMPSRAQLSDAVPRLTALVDYATTAQSILAIDPRIITAIRGYGTEAPREGSELLARLETTALPSFLLQFGDADPAAQAALGLEELLQPAGFEFITRFGAWEPQLPEAPETTPQAPGAGDTPEGAPGGEGTADASGTAAATRATARSSAADAGGAHATTSAATKSDAAQSAAAKSAKEDPNEDPTEDPAEDPAPEPDKEAGKEQGKGAGADPATDDEPLPPTAEELREWPRGLPAAWPAGGEVGSRTLTLLRGAELGTTVLSSDNVRLTGGPRATLGAGEALVTDAELDAAVRLALTGATDTERALGESQAAARLTLAASAGVEGLILGIDRGAVAESERPEERLSKLTSERWIRPVAVGAQREGAAQLIPSSPGEDRVELLAAALENESTVLEARAMLVNPEYLDSYQRMRLLTLLGTRGAGPDVDFESVARQFAKRDAELHDGVRLVDTKRAQLVGGSTRIPIQLRNSLPFDAIVNLEVAPTSAALLVPEREFTNITLPEDSSERVLVPANSRVSSGESALLLTVTSVDGDYTASTGRLEVAISSTLETVAIAVLGSAAALLFGFGIWRSVRRRKSLSPRE